MKSPKCRVSCIWIDKDDHAPGDKYGRCKLIQDGCWHIDPFVRFGNTCQVASFCLKYMEGRVKEYQDMYQTLKDGMERKKENQ